MPSLSALLGQLQSFVQGQLLGGAGGSSSTAKKWATALAVLVTMLWLYRRLEQARANEARRGGGRGNNNLPPPLRDARGNLLPHNIALGQHAPSPVPLAHHETADANDVRTLAPAERYLSERGSRVRRQSVCLTLSATNGVVFELPDSGDDGTLKVQDAVAPLLAGLAQHSLLYLVAVETDSKRQAAMLKALEDIGLFDADGTSASAPPSVAAAAAAASSSSSSHSSNNSSRSGLKKHRVLFCSSAKGKGSIVRHLEPNLCLDDDRAILAGLKPFLDQVVHVRATGTETTAAAAASASSSPDANIPSYPSLLHFFLPKQAQ
jgi:hypothetical protein